MGSDGALLEQCGNGDDTVGEGDDTAGEGDDTTQNNCEITSDALIFPLSTLLSRALISSIIPFTPSATKRVINPSSGSTFSTSEVFSVFILTTFCKVTDEYFLSVFLN